MAKASAAVAHRLCPSNHQQTVNSDEHPQKQDEHRCWSLLVSATIRKSSQLLILNRRLLIDSSSPGVLGTDRAPPVLHMVCIRPCTAASGTIIECHRGAKTPTRTVLGVSEPACQRCHRLSAVSDPAKALREVYDPSWPT
jgi:hypothetical protein